MTNQSTDRYNYAWNDRKYSTSSICKILMVPTVNPPNWDSLADNWYQDTEGAEIVD